MSCKCRSSPPFNMHVYIRKYNNKYINEDEEEVAHTPESHTHTHNTNMTASHTFFFSNGHHNPVFQIHGPHLHVHYSPTPPHSSHS